MQQQDRASKSQARHSDEDPAAKVRFNSPVEKIASKDRGIAMEDRVNI